MGISMVIDFSIFLVLLGTLLFLIYTKAISHLSRVYMSLHLAFMFWALLQFAASTTTIMDYRFLFIKLSYVVLTALGIGAVVFTLFITNRSSFLKSKTFKLFLLPTVAAVIFVMWNPNHLFLTINNDLQSEKQFVYGQYFGAVITLLLLHIACAIFLLIRYYIKSKSESMARHVCRFAMNGIGLVLLFGCFDLIINIIYIDWNERYFPLLSIGMLCTAVYMSININRINVLDIISIAQRDVLNTISIGILILDRDFHIVEKNELVDQFLTLEIGERIDVRKIKQQLPQSTWLAIENKLMEFEKNPLVKLEIKWSTNDNQARHLHIQSYPIMNKQQKLKGYMFTIQDITEFKNLTESLKRQNELLQLRNHELIQTQEELYEANQKLENMAITDALTECYNRRYLMQFLEKELVKNIVEKIPFTIIIFDLDYFKLINDAYGHLNGDTVLVHTAKKVKSLLSSRDRLARYGGEEFLVYLPELSIVDAQRKAEEIKNEIENNQIWLEDVADNISVTISVGIVTIDNYEQFKITDSKVFLQEVMSLADAALYEAKYNGRNLIVNRSSAIS